MDYKKIGRESFTPEENRNAEENLAAVKAALVKFEEIHLDPGVVESLGEPQVNADLKLSKGIQTVEDLAALVATVSYLMSRIPGFQDTIVATTLAGQGWQVEMDRENRQVRLSPPARPYVSPGSSTPN